MFSGVAVQKVFPTLVHYWVATQLSSKFQSKCVFVNVGLRLSI